jgi:hypothetical protein
MPVQIWHKHAHTITGRDAAVLTIKKPVTSFIDGSKNYLKECKVCAHQYPGYYDDQQKIQIEPLVSFLLQHAVFTPSLSELSSYGLLNKGPPTIYIPISAHHC